MTTKETFLSLGISDPYHETADRIDFDALDEFVKMFIVAYLHKRGADIIKDELSADAPSETNTFLTRLVEAGTPQFMAQNDLITADTELTADLATVIAHGVNISIASELQLNGLDELGSNVFFEIRSLYTIIERIIIHITNSRSEPGYIFSLVNFNLLNFVNSATGE